MRSSRNRKERGQKNRCYVRGTCVRFTVRINAKASDRIGGSVVSTFPVVYDDRFAAIPTERHESEAK